MKEIFAKFMGDGSHCGLTDFYKPQKNELAKAIKLGKAFSTGWWASKKEIASAKLDFDGCDTYTVTVSVSDDLDTEGSATGAFVTKSRNATRVMKKMTDCIYGTWDKANENQKDNQTWAMYCIGEMKKGKRINWLETYLVDAIGEQDSPPGDSYDKWGWQDESKLPVKIKKELEDGMLDLQFKVKSGKYIAEMVID